jgi:hypothetical protein
MTSPSVIAMTMVSALLVTSCASDSDALSTQEWIEAANAICVDVKADENAIPTPQTIEELTTASDQIIELDQQAVAELKDLGLPGGDDAAKADAIVEAFDDFSAAREEVLNAVIAGGSIDELTPEAETLANAFQTALENVNQLTQDFGLSDCLVES